MSRNSKGADRLCACGCGRPLRSRGAQYLLGHRPLVSLEERFAGKWVEVESGCWEWTRCISPQGYGEIGIPGSRRVMGAHRASWVIHHGPIPDGLFVCHKCDNRKCVNPGHLFLGTPKDNVHDMIAKGRQVKTAGERASNARLTSAQVAEIRSRYRPPIGKRSRSNALELAEEFGITPQYVSQLARGMWRVAG